MGRPKIGDGSAKNRPMSMTDETNRQLDEIVEIERAAGGKVAPTRAGVIRRLVEREWKRLERKTAAKGNV